jgi:hypothetical protein
VGELLERVRTAYWSSQLNLGATGPGSVPNYKELVRRGEAFAIVQNDHYPNVVKLGSYLPGGQRVGWDDLRGAYEHAAGRLNAAARLLEDRCPNPDEYIELGHEVGRTALDGVMVRTGPTSGARYTDYGLLVGGDLTEKFYAEGGIEQAIGTNWPEWADYSGYQVPAKAIRDLYETMARQHFTSRA